MGLFDKLLEPADCGTQPAPADAAPKESQITVSRVAQNIAWEGENGAMRLAFADLTLVTRVMGIVMTLVLTGVTARISVQGNRHLGFPGHTKTIDGTARHFDSFYPKSAEARRALTKLVFEHPEIAHLEAEFFEKRDALLAARAAQLEERC